MLNLHALLIGQCRAAFHYQTDRDIYYQAIITKYTHLSHTQFSRVFMDGYSLMCSYLIWKNIAPVYTHMGTGVSHGNWSIQLAQWEGKRRVGLCCEQRRNLLVLSQW